MLLCAVLLLQLPQLLIRKLEKQRKLFFQVEIDSLSTAAPA